MVLYLKRWTVRVDIRTDVRPLRATYTVLHLGSCFEIHEIDPVRLTILTIKPRKEEMRRETDSELKMFGYA